MRCVCVLAAVALCGGVTTANAAAATPASTPVQFTSDVPLYVEQAFSAGIDHHYDGPWEYFVGGGVAAFDCNQDRMPDLFFAGGEGPAGLYINESQAGGALHFTRLPSPITDLTGVTGAYPLDIDNDGYRDLVVLRVGENRLLRGGPDCSFTHANSSFRYEGGRAWTTGFTATFEAQATFPTLAFGNYVDRTAPGSPWGTCHDNELLRPVTADDGVSYASVQPLTPGYCSLSILFTDWNKSGSDALRITNDRQYYRGGQEQLWRLDAGRYPRLYTQSEGWQPLVIWGMGIAEGDFNADGYPEYLLTSMGDTKLQSLDLVAATEENRPAYEDIAYTSGATAHRPYTGDDLKPSTGWHTAIADVNNDARLDIFISKGNVESMNDFASFDPDNLLLGQTGERFSEQGEVAGIALDRRGRGAATVDLNADGLLDIVVVNRAAPVSLFRHNGTQIMQPADGSLGTEEVVSTDATPVGEQQAATSPVSPRSVRTLPGGNWLQIELAQAGVNRNAIGARLAIKTGNVTQMRRIQVGGGHASGSAGFVHVGLGVAERATLRVQWPDGEWSAAYRLFANNFVIITRGDRHVSYWYPESEPEAE